MLFFKTEGGHFNLRVAGIAIHANRVLLHRAVVDNYWALPGGRIEHMETAQDALIREMQEEIKVTVSVRRLVAIVEGFFPLKGVPCHEVGFYYLMDVPPEITARDTFDGIEGQDLRLIFNWMPLDSLHQKVVKPDFLPHF